MIRRTMSAVALNAVANDPQVRPWIGGVGAVDLQPMLDDPANVTFEADGGGFVFRWMEAGRYELHTLFLPEGRGAPVLAAFAEAARYLFTRTDAVEIVTKTAGSNRAAALMARRAGFRPIFTRPGAWDDGSDLTFYALSFDEWRARDATLETEGHAFHAALETAKRATGSALPVHADDEAHDRAVGAAVFMLKAGQPRKAVWAYNRWAALAGYAPVALISDAPPIIDIQDAVLTLIDGELEVLKCR